MRRELESLAGVGQVLLVGGQPRQVNLWLDPARLRAYNLTVAEVARAVANQNLSLPGGNVGQGARELTVRMKGRVDSVREFDGLVVASRDGTHVKLQDVGRAEDGTEELETAANIDGRPTVLLAIRKQSGTNTVAVIDGVKQRLGALEPRLPAGYSLRDRPRPVGVHRGVRRTPCRSTWSWAPSWPPWWCCSSSATGARPSSRPSPSRPRSSRRSR